MPRRAINWPACAAELARRIPRAQLHPAVVAWSARRARTEKWSVALSGGADSLALLLLVWSHWPERRARLQALHFDHRLRGRASRRDAVFCRKVCAALGVKFVAGEWKGAHRDASEAEARTARMAFFARHGRILWFGHQQDDVAESMLMRLARGSGAGGLAAPRPVHRQAAGRVHLRPLLGRKKADLCAALAAAGATWREDATNSGGDFFRNRIRRDVIPRWAEAARRDALGGAACARELLEEDDVALEAWVDALKPLASGGRVLVLRVLADKPRAVVRRALHRWLRAQTKAGDISRTAFEVLLDAVVEGRRTRHSLGREGFAAIRAGELRFESAGKPRPKFQRSTN